MIAARRGRASRARRHPPREVVSPRSRSSRSGSPGRRPPGRPQPLQVLRQLQLRSTAWTMSSTSSGSMAGRSAEHPLGVIPDSPGTDLAQASSSLAPARPSGGARSARAAPADRTKTGRRAGSSLQALARRNGASSIKKSRRVQDCPRALNQSRRSPPGPRPPRARFSRTPCEHATFSEQGLPLLRLRGGRARDLDHHGDQEVGSEQRLLGDWPWLRRAAASSPASRTMLRPRPDAAAQLPCALSRCCRRSR